MADGVHQDHDSSRQREETSALEEDELDRILFLLGNDASGARCERRRPGVAIRTRQVQRRKPKSRGDESIDLTECHILKVRGVVSVEAE